MNLDFTSKYWTQFSNYVRSSSLSKFSIQELSNHIHKIVPAVAGIVVGGSIIYVWRNGYLRKIQKNRKDGPIQIDILQLPTEARRLIWTKLSYEDLLKLRLVSDFTKDDVDNFIGLKLTISSRQMEKYEFSQTIALQCCTITDLAEEIGSNFFADPYLMREVNIRERAPSQISLTNIINILGPCVNLKRLKLRFSYTSPITDLSEIIINALHNMDQLTHLEITRIATQSIQEKAFPLDISRISFPCPKFLQHLQLEIPDISDDQVTAWKYVLEQQTQLKTLVVHVGAVQWEYFYRVIPKNFQLEKVGLLSLKGYRIDTQEDKPFDWGIFENCSMLKSLELTCNRTSGQRGSDCMSCINFHLIPCSNIEEFHVSRLILSPENVQKIYKEMPKLQRGSLDHIGENGTARAEELSWIFHQQQEIDREYWFSRDRVWDAIFHTLIGLSAIGVIVVASVSRPKSTGNESQNEDLK